ncbi:hypothetical protein [Chitinophaga sp. MM2321]|uniref:hypothetical protein n=1 Tax=Chitinophaga sp. MM2321 TaxID=3137178 RepID=UPI0032D586E6
MLMFNKHALKTGVVMATVLGITFTSCSNDDNPDPVPTPRSKSFTLKGTGADATKDVGAITVTENTDSSINVILSLTKNVKDTSHQVYFIGGTTTTPLTDTLYANEDVKGTGAAMNIELFKNVKKITLKQASGATKDTAFKFDNAVHYAAYLKVMHSKTSTDTLAIGNFGESN